jgi:hypothetical protein
MQDFILDSTDPVSYGFIAHSMQEPNRAILAIRGTSNGVEWWDDVNTLGMTVFRVPNSGNVGLGFAKIYDTIEIIPSDVPEVEQRSLKPAGGLAEQVFTLLKQRAALIPDAHAAATSSIEVTGHSLGAALATLYVMENARPVRF